MAENKDKKVLNVPNLRFPEFEGEWENCKVSELLDFYSTNSLSWDKLEYGTNAIQNLHYGLIHVGLPTMVDLDNDKLPNIVSGNTPKNYELCQEGDIAFADASEDTNEVAKAVEFYNLNGKDVICGLHTIHGRDNQHKTIVGYKGYAFSSMAFHQQIRRIAQGTKIYSINSKNFSECYIGIPSKREQKKIATLLRLIDERISTQNKIIEDLKKLKSTIIDYAIGSLDTNFMKFGSVYETAREGGTPTTSNTSFYNNGKIPFIKIGDLKQKYLIENKDFITELGLQKSSAWLVPTHSILFSNGATIGEITITTYPVCTKQGILGIVPKANIDVEFLYYFMSSSYFKKAVSRIITEGTMKTAYLRNIDNILCPIPTKEKQLKIAKVPSALNLKIDSEQSILRLLYAQKRYLLHQMFR